jgi:ribosomal protein S18 acetylase RimI-like enzyme
VTSTPIILKNLDDQIKNLPSITAFYNAFFLKSQHSPAYKLKMYQDPSRQPIILSINSNGQTIGLLESWNKRNNPKKRIISTLLIHPDFRGRSYSRKLFEEAVKISQEKSENPLWIIHFRDDNKTNLQAIYTKLGFSNLKSRGTYQNGEIKWEMNIAKSN